MNKELFHTFSPHIRKSFYLHIKCTLHQLVSLNLYFFFTLPCADIRWLNLSNQSIDFWLTLPYWDMLVYRWNVASLKGVVLERTNSQYPYIDIEIGCFHMLKKKAIKVVDDFVSHPIWCFTSFLTHYFYSMRIGWAIRISNITHNTTYLLPLLLAISHVFHTPHILTHIG